jgi:hypothetical protein
MDWLTISGRVALATCIVICLALVWSRERRYSRKLEHHLKQILRTRYTHPEELSEALSDAEIEFYDLTPAGMIGVTNNAGDFVLRQDATVGLEPPCDVPPAGWYCTRKRGHSGPCAALPVDRRKVRGHQPQAKPQMPRRGGGYQPEPCKMPPPPAPAMDNKTIESCKLRFPVGVFPGELTSDKIGLPTQFERDVVKVLVKCGLMEQR